jgi:SAM-dependent methyltransferase
MSKPVIEKAFGREAFGLDPAGYHAARPDCPDWVYHLLCDSCGLRENVATFEIGPGTGIATRHLLELGANPLVAVEPDNRLADFLCETIRSEVLTVVRSTFEDARLPGAGFDLGFSATAFHWLDEEAALRKVADLLRPGGWWVMVWNDFGDPDRADPFHEATTLLLNGPSSSSMDDREISFAQDKDARLASLERTHLFDRIGHRRSTWSLVLDPDQVVNLYATYSTINFRPDRESILAELGRIAREKFQGVVTRNMTTSLYVARRTTFQPFHKPFE